MCANGWAEKARSFRAVEVLGQESRSLQGFVVLRLNIVEAQTVIQRQAWPYLPGVLDIKLKICIPVLAGWIGGRLIETLENTSRGVGITEAGIEGVGGRVDEVNVAVGVAKYSLVFPTVLKIDASLQRMIAYEFAEVIDNIKGPVVVKEGGVVGAVVGAVGYSATVEIELRYVIILNRAGEERRQVGQPVNASRQACVGGVYVDLVLSEPDHDLIDHRRAK